LPVAVIHLFFISFVRYALNRELQKRWLSRDTCRTTIRKVIFRRTWISRVPPHPWCSR